MRVKVRNGVMVRAGMGGIRRCIWDLASSVASSVRLTAVTAGNAQRYF